MKKNLLLVVAILMAWATHSQTEGLLNPRKNSVSEYNTIHGEVLQPKPNFAESKSSAVALISMMR